MAYMNFNTDTKFWQHLQVEGIQDSESTIDASGYIAYDSSFNNGLISIYHKKSPTEGVLAWEPIVYQVHKSAGTVSGGAVTQDHGVVTITFPPDGTTGGGGSVKTFIANIDTDNAGNTITSFSIGLPDVIYTAATDYISTRVFAVDEYNNHNTEVVPEVTIANRTIGSGQDQYQQCWIKFDFGTNEDLKKNRYYKAYVIYDGSSTLATTGIWNLVASDLTPASGNVSRTSMSNKQTGN